MDQEIIELLETIFAIADNDEPEALPGEPLASFPKIKELADQALTLLKQPKCKTCGDTGKVTGLGDIMLNNPEFPEKYPETMDCPDCQQPSASEFTNDVKFVVTAWKNCKKINPKNPLAVAEAIPDLLERLEKTTKYLEIRTKKQSRFSIPRLVDKIIEANRAAITEANKEG